MPPNNSVKLGMTKSEKTRIAFIILGLAGLIILASMLSRLRTEQNEQNQKIEVIDNNPEVIEFRQKFEYNPNYDDFFEVEDDLEENSSPEMSEGEMKIRQILGSKFYRVMPRLVQNEAKESSWQDLKSNSNPNKGKIVSAVGKVESIRKNKEIESQTSVQFAYSIIIKFDENQFYDLHVQRAPSELKKGDVVFCVGVYLKQKIDRILKIQVPVILSGNANILLPSPNFWQTKSDYSALKNNYLKENQLQLDLNKIPTLEKWEKEHQDIIEKNQSVWQKMQSDEDESVLNLDTNIEKKVIENLSVVPNRVLFEEASFEKSLNDLKENSNENKGKIVRIVGKLKSIREAMLAEPINGVTKVYYSLVEDIRGEEAYFCSLYHQNIDEEALKVMDKPELLIPKEGDIVVCVGAYLRTIKEKDTVRPLVYGKNLSVIGAYEMIWDSIDQGERRTSMNDYGKGTYVEAGILEKMPFSYLLAKVSSMSADEIKQQYLKIPQMQIPLFQDMMIRPELQHDKIYLKYGKVNYIQELKGVNYPDYHGVKSVYEIFFHDRDRQLHSFLSLNKPEGVYVNKRMTFIGYFFKRFAFRNREKTISWTPYLVGKILEVEKPEITKFEPVKFFAGFGLAIVALIGIVLLNKQNMKSMKRINQLRSEQVKKSRLSKEQMEKLAETGKHLDELLLIPYHQSLFEEYKIAVESCSQEERWVPYNDGSVFGQWRPESLNLVTQDVIRHLLENNSVPSKTIMNALQAKRKELLGYRPFQKSKFTIGDGERKRDFALLVVPLNGLKEKGLDNVLKEMGSYFDENGLPPWQTWVKICEFPKFLNKNFMLNIKPTEHVLLAWVPNFMELEFRNKFKVCQSGDKKNDSAS